jgi:predicted signal transduction protein with EAL and GGDEF domain
MCTSVDLVRMADLAMYRAKAAGRNLVRIASDDLRREAEERAEIEYALRGAIANGDMQVVYQPIIDLATGSLTGSRPSPAGTTRRSVMCRRTDSCASPRKQG